MSRSVVIALIALGGGCVAHRQPGASARVDEIKPMEDARLGNLQRAARYPWKDDGRCVVAEASSTWAVLVDRCFDALDLSRIRFEDPQGACRLAQAGAIPADAALRLVGVCLLVQPELAVGAVIVIGAVVVAAAIAAEIEAAQVRKGCTCFCAGKNILHGDGTIKVKDISACNSYCWANYPNTIGVCK